MLELRGVSRNFGGLKAVRDVDLHVREGQLVGIIGRNGAGKTTLFNLIAGRYAPSAGSMRFMGSDVTDMRAFQRARLGIGRTFQIPNPLGRLDVFENVLAGAFATISDRNEASQAAWQALTICGLASKARMRSAELTVADLKRLEVARAFVTQPKLLLLDEVMAGLRPAEVREAMELCRRIRAEGITIIIVEHVMYAVMNLCERVIVVEQGSVIADGAPEEIQRDEHVIDIYLGRSRDA